jgi:HK97 family phage prohead protease
MPYYITDEGQDCSGWATVTEEGTVIGCHKTKQDAIDQMVAVSIAEGLKPGGTYQPRANSELSETRIDSGNSNDEVVVNTDTIKTENRWLSVANGLISRLSPIHEAPVSEERGKKMETRINHTEVEFREVQDGKGMTFEGYASVFNSPSEPIGGQFTEYVKPGAFKRSLDARNDVKLLWNHDTGEVLGSTRAGTLRLVEDSHGLKAVAELPNTQRGRDTAELLRRGDVANMSFGFSVPKGGDSWSDNGGTRELHSVRLHEVSIVAYPAYSASTASVRAVEFSADDLAESLMLLENGEDLSEEQAQMIMDVVGKLVKTDSMDVSTDPAEPLAMIPLTDGMDAPDGMPAAEDDSEMEDESGSKISVEVEIELNGSNLDVKKKNLDLLMKRL